MNIARCIEIPDPLAQDCPSRAMLDLIGDRWSLLILLVVGQGTHRNGEMKRRIGGISQKMLTQTLRALEANGLVERKDFQTVPPHVEYHLTALGMSLQQAMAPLFGWVEREFAAVLAARAEFAERTGA
jgi:DNA-binding HxlR family transcriptional regulator